MAAASVVSSTASARQQRQETTSTLYRNSNRATATTTTTARSSYRSASTTCTSSVLSRPHLLAIILLLIASSMMTMSSLLYLHAAWRLSIPSSSSSSWSTWSFLRSPQPSLQFLEKQRRSASTPVSSNETTIATAAGGVSGGGNHATAAQVWQHRNAQQQQQQQVREAAHAGNDHNSTEAIARSLGLPLALWPVTFEGCCTHETEEIKKFPLTCLTEVACVNDAVNDATATAMESKSRSQSFYPFGSAQEANMFRPWEPAQSGATDKHHRKACNQACAQVAATATRKKHDQWCATTTTVTSTTGAASSSYPMGCSRHYGMGGKSGPYERLYLFPQGKLAFCGIPKAGITQWLHFLRFSIGAKDYQSIPYAKRDLEAFRLDLMTPQVQQDIWQSNNSNKNNSSWTKAIFIREPAERLLSAYLDKIAFSPTRHQKPFGNDKNLTFADFVNILAAPNVTQLFRGGAFTGLSWCHTDPHWRPQAWACGLANDLHHFDYVAPLGDRDLVAHHSRALLQKVNMWESLGKHYRVTKLERRRGTSAVTWPPDVLNAPKDIAPAVGFQQQPPNLQGRRNNNNNKYKHVKDRHSRGARQLISQYYTPELMNKVKELYWMDFALWDALQEADKEGLVSGKDIAQKLNPECAKR